MSIASGAGTGRVSCCGSKRQFTKDPARAVDRRLSSISSDLRQVRTAYRPSSLMGSHRSNRLKYLARRRSEGGRLIQTPRTPAGTQNETLKSDGSCHRCGDPRGSFDEKLQGRVLVCEDCGGFRMVKKKKDDGSEWRCRDCGGAALPGGSGGKAPKHCLSCTMALISGADPMGRPSEGDLGDSEGPRCEECGLPLIRGKGKTCGVRCRVALWRRLNYKVA